MPGGKPAGVPCVNLDGRAMCAVHGKPDYPAVCRNFRPSAEMCGDSAEHARRYLTDLEERTR
jgi:uncharacterized protein